MKNKEFNKDKFCQAIIDKRFEGGLSMATAAKQCGLSKGGFHRVEVEGLVSVAGLVAVCNWLDVSLQDFFK